MPVERSNHRGHNAYLSSLPYQRAQLGTSSMVGPQMQPATGGQSSWMGTMGTMQMAASQMHPGHYPRQQQVYSKDGYFSQHAGMFMGTSQVAQAGPVNMQINNQAPNHPPSNDGDTILLYQPYKPPTQVPSVERPEYAFTNNALQLDLGPVAGSMGGTPQYIHSGYPSSSSTPLSNGSQRSVAERTRRADGPHRPPVFMPERSAPLQDSSSRFKRPTITRQPRPRPDKPPSPPDASHRWRSFLVPD
ncbi:hypothetical protein SCHPADRAFT_446646 [Schizopora paradoxa]|uniref:Uncharacterized protein n=1 Tax=Schizopora paradoxa TaxID=27342 RepID=A0A0H2RK22_9AGAM|nr:hypothetical protein SCHPADRAFT_446646 [Schizopora paradoxa]